MQRFINKKIFLGLLALILLLIANYFFTHGILTIQSTGGEEQTVYVRSGEFEEKIVLKNSSRRLVLSSGNYEIEVLNGNRQSLYDVKLRTLWPVKKLSVDTKSLRSSVFLGRNILPCARQDGSGSPVFYSCNPSTAGLVNSGTQSTTETATDDEGSFIPANQNGTFALRPYKEGFLQLHSGVRGATVETRDTGMPIVRNNLSGFGGTVTDNTFSASEEGFVAFDQKASVLYISAANNVSSYETLKIDEGEFLNDDPSASGVVDAGKYIYIISTGSDEEMANNSDKKEQGTRVLVVDRKKRAVIETKDLGKEAINSFVGGADGNLLLVFGRDSVDRLRVLVPGGGVQLLAAVKSSVQQACYASRDRLYYLADSGHAIYEYFAKEAVSRLMYSNPESNILRINCVGGNLYFSGINERDDETGLDSHYTLGEAAHSGVNLDSVLPIYATVNQDSFKIGRGHEGLILELMYDSDGNGVPDRAAVQARAVELLQQKGINPSGLVFIFQF